jgi:hypothetical protein
MDLGLEEHGGRAGLVQDVTGSGSSGAASSAGSARQGLVEREFQVDLSSMFALPRAPSVGPEGRGGMSKEEFQASFRNPLHTPPFPSPWPVRLCAAARDPRLHFSH